MDFFHSPLSTEVMLLFRSIVSKFYELVLCKKAPLLGFFNSNILAINVIT